MHLFALDIVGWVDWVSVGDWVRATDFLGFLELKKVLGWMDIGVWGYLVLFGLLFSCGVGMPLPEDVPLLVAGMLVGTDKMHLLPAAVAAWCGIIGGDCVLYYLGHRFGPRITKAPLIGKHVTMARIGQAERLFARYGVWVVAVGRLFAGIRGAMVVAAGTIRFSFTKFFIADGLAALVSGGLFVWLGIKFSQNIDPIEAAVKRNEKWVTIGLITVIALFILYKWSRRGKPGVTDVVAEKVATEGIHLPHLPLLHHRTEEKKEEGPVGGAGQQG